MNKCMNCSKETMNPKFCSRNCSASFNNKKFIKRFRKGVCICGKSILSKHTYCDDCKIKYRKIRRPKKDQYKFVRGLRLRRKHEAVNLLGGKCAICGYNKCLRSLQFHHRNPEEKSFTVSTNFNKSWKLILEELSKCTLVCANCHGEIESGLISL